MFTQNHQFGKIHVEKIRERLSLRIKKTNAKSISKGLGWGREACFKRIGHPLVLKAAGNYLFSKLPCTGGGGKNSRICLGHPPGQPKMRLSNSDIWKWQIWILQKIGFLVENREVSTFYPAAGFRISPPGSTSQTRRIHPPGQISQFYPPGLIMTRRVCMYAYVYICLLLFDAI